MKPKQACRGAGLKTQPGCWPEDPAGAGDNRPRQVGRTPAHAGGRDLGPARGASLAGATQAGRPSREGPERDGGPAGESG
jgi:hypothetical protein